MDRTAIWPLIDPVFYALSEAVDKDIAPAFIAEGFQGIQWWIAHQAWVFADEPFTARTLQRRMPFAAPALLDDAILDLLADRLFLHIDEGVYQLSAKGYGVVTRLLGALDEAIACLEPMPVDDLDRLVDLLHQAVEAILDAPEPAIKETTLITHHRQRPGDDAHALIRIWRNLDTIRAFHDEVDREVWGDLVNAPPEWDAFMTLAGAGGMTSAALLEQLSTARAYPDNVYRKAIDSLAGRGWVAANGDSRTYCLTGKGRRVWREAQAGIGDLFARPLSALSDVESAELVRLLSQLKRELQR